jgi:predicted nucleic acid-binding Zn ribbon protein
MKEYWYGAVYCDRCDKTHYYRADIMQGYADYIVVTCPNCWKHLRHIRADLGYSIIGSKPGDQGYFSVEAGEDTYIEDVDKLIHVAEDLLKGSSG